MNIHIRRTGIALLLSTLVGCSSFVKPAEVLPGSTRLPQSVTPSIVALATAGPEITSANINTVGSIQPGKAMHFKRAAHTATLLPNGQVLIAGGFGQGDNAYTDSAELYDPVSGNFTLTGKMNIKRCCHTATLLPDERVLIAGGFNGDYLSEVEIYDPRTGGFIPIGSMTTPRMDHVAVLLENGKVLLAGGVGPGWTFLASAELYDPVTGTFAPTGDMTVARESHTITRL